MIIQPLIEALLFYAGYRTTLSYLSTSHAQDDSRRWLIENKTVIDERNLAAFNRNAASRWGLHILIDSAHALQQICNRHRDRRFVVYFVTVSDEGDSNLLKRCIDPSRIHVTHLLFEEHFDKPLTHMFLPATLTFLSINLWMLSLHQAQAASCAANGQSCDTFDDILKRVIWPPNLEHLSIDVLAFHGHFIPLPSTLTRLTVRQNLLHHGLIIHMCADFPLLTHLTFGDEYARPFTELVRLPRNLTHLAFGDRFNWSIESLRLPQSLTHLRFGNDFNGSLDAVALPASITHLWFGDDFNQPLDNVTLPANLRYLSFGVAFEQSLLDVKMPPTLYAVTFGRTFVSRMNRHICWRSWLGPGVKRVWLTDDRKEQFEPPI